MKSLFHCSLLSLTVAVDDSAAVGAEINAAEDPRITSDSRVTGAAPLVLVVIDAHPSLTGINRTKDATHTRDLGHRVKREVRLPRRSLSKTDIVSFDVRKSGKT